MKSFVFGSFVMTLCLVMAGCPQSDPQRHVINDRVFYLPKGAINVKDQGDGWCTFEFEGKRFLFYRTSDRAALTQLIEK